MLLLAVLHNIVVRSAIRNFIGFQFCTKTKRTAACAVPALWAGTGGLAAD